jgi:hypothetical protein
VAAWLPLQARGSRSRGRPQYAADARPRCCMPGPGWAGVGAGCCARRNQHKWRLRYRSRPSTAHRPRPSHTSAPPAASAPRPSPLAPRRRAQHALTIVPRAQPAVRARGALRRHGSVPGLHRRGAQAARAAAEPSQAGPPSPVEPAAGAPRLRWRRGGRCLASRSSRLLLLAIGGAAPQRRGAGPNMLSVRRVQVPQAVELRWGAASVHCRAQVAPAGGAALHQCACCAGRHTGRARRCR